MMLMFTIASGQVGTMHRPRDGDARVVHQHGNQRS